jgi:formylmethanofuran dehydrogenase subunit E
MRHEQIYQKVFGDYIEQLKMKDQERKLKRKEWQKQYQQRPDAKEKDRERVKRYRKKHRDKWNDYIKLYYKKNTITKWKTLGTIICKKCGEKGYASQVTRIAKKTGKIASRILVQHYIPRYKYRACSWKIEKEEF